jgi:hypothetical protein
LHMLLMTPADGARVQSAILFLVYSSQSILMTGGLFSKLAGLSPLVEQAYSLASTAGDLTLGDAHMVKLDFSRFVTVPYNAIQFA